MPDRKFSLITDKTVNIPVSAVDKLISSKDGNAALLYIYLMRSGSPVSIAQISEATKMSEQELTKAYSVLISLGLAANGESGESVGEDIRKKPPEYSIDEINSELENGAEFRLLQEAVKTSLGKPISTEDIKKIYGIYDFLGMPPEVILTLVNYCISEYRYQYNGRRMPTMNYIEKNAYAWARDGISTLDLAEAKIKYLLEKRTLTGKIKTALGIADRALVKSEQSYIDSWVDMGFPIETLELAYDRTVLRTGKFAWGYMDSILKSWKAKNLITPDEAESELGSGKVSVKNGVKAEVSVTGEDMRRMQKLINEMNGGNNNE